MEDFSRFSEGEKKKKKKKRERERREETFWPLRFEMTCDVWTARALLFTRQCASVALLFVVCEVTERRAALLLNSDPATSDI